MTINDIEQHGGTIVRCPRCGTPGRVGGGGDRQARIAHYADQAAVTRGAALCLECAVTRWLKELPIAVFLEGPGGAQKLLAPAVQQQFAAMVAASGHEDFSAAQIDWQRVVASWDLPLPKPKRKGRR